MLLPVLQGCLFCLHEEGAHPLNALPLHNTQS